MKNTFRMIGIIAVVAVIGFMTISCEEPKPQEPKTLIITGQSTKGDVGIFPTGKTVQQILENGDALLVAGADYNNSDYTVSGSTLTIPLYNKTGGTRWTGSGNYDVYLMLDSGIYKATINFSSETTTVALSQFTKISS